MGLGSCPCFFRLEANLFPSWINDCTQDLVWFECWLCTVRELGSFLSKPRYAQSFFINSSIFLVSSFSFMSPFDTSAYTKRCLRWLCLTSVAIDKVWNPANHHSSFPLAGPVPDQGHRRTDWDAERSTSASFHLTASNRPSFLWWTRHTSYFAQPSARRARRRGARKAGYL